MTSSSDSEAPAVIGVDLGATEVKVHEVAVDPSSGRLALGSAAHARVHSVDPAFRPLAVEEQVRQAEGALRWADGEREAAAAWVASTADCIGAVAAELGRSEVLLGIAAPGRKSADGRGTIAVRNGPRVPDFAERLESLLRAAGLTLVRQVKLRGDGVCGCAGESASVRGSFADVRNGYYVGGGTGLAEAWLVDGRAVDVSAHAQPAWRLGSESGAVFEDRLSMRAIRTRAHPDADVAVALAELVHRRAGELASGADARLERVVVAQRLGYWVQERGAAFVERFARELGARVAANDPWDGELLDGDLLGEPRLRPGFFAASTFRAAPALGAASAAWNELSAR